MAIQQRIKAAKQGQLDGACGFYAIANAIHLLEPELQQEEIFRLIFEDLIEYGNPKKFLDGTFRGSIKNSLSRVLKKLNETYIFTLNETPYIINFEIPYWIEDKPRSREDVLRILGSANHKQGNVILMGYTYNDGNEEYAHWTVIKQCKDGYIRTFDSSQEDKKIALDNTRIDAQRDQNTLRPYNIISGDIFQIWRQ